MNAENHMLFDKSANEKCYNVWVLKLARMLMNFQKSFRAPDSNCKSKEQELHQIRRKFTQRTVKAMRAHENGEFQSVFSKTTRTM